MKAFARAAALSLTVGCAYFDGPEKQEDIGALAAAAILSMRPGSSSEPEKEFRLPRPELNRATVVVDGEIHYDRPVEECDLKSWKPFLWVKTAPKYYDVESISYSKVPEEPGLYTFPPGQDFDKGLSYGSHRPTDYCVLHTLEYTDRHYEAEMRNCTVYDGNDYIQPGKKYHTISFRLRCVPAPPPDCAKNPGIAPCSTACWLFPEYPACKGCREERPGEICSPSDVPS